MAAQQSPDWEDEVCNKRLVREVSEEMNLKFEQIESILKFHTDFTALTIRAGALEGVFFPYLGKIQVKHRNQQYRAHIHALPPDYRRLLTQSAPEDLNQLFKSEELKKEDDQP